MLPETPRERIAWTVEESLVVLGVLVFWTGVVAVVTIALGILTLPYQYLGITLFRPFVDLARLGGSLWAGVLPLTLLSSSLYVLARVGELLIDYHFETTAERDRPA